VGGAGVFVGKLVGMPTTSFEIRRKEEWEGSEAITNRPFLKGSKGRKKVFGILRKCVLELTSRVKHGKAGRRYTAIAV
jgi:hypothetical protein